MSPLTWAVKQLYRPVVIPSITNNLQLSALLTLEPGDSDELVVAGVYLLFPILDWRPDVADEGVEKLELLPLCT